MTAVLNNKRQISLKLEAPLYSLLEQQADENGEALNALIPRLLTKIKMEDVAGLISRLLSEAVDHWCEYCATVRQLASDDDAPVRLSVK